MNLFGSAFKGVTNADEPLHYGEVMALWTMLAAVQEGRALCLATLNHTDDPDLTRIIERTIKDIQEPIGKQLEELLKDSGVPLPPVTPDPPKADPTDVPPGAKLLEEQIAQLVVGKLEAYLLICHNGLAQSLRNDVGAMFFKFQTQFLGEGAVLKATMKERGWLKVPPIHYPRRSPTT